MFLNKNGNFNKGKQTSKVRIVLISISVATFSHHCCFDMIVFVSKRALFDIYLEAYHHCIRHDKAMELTQQMVIIGTIDSCYL